MMELAMVVVLVVVILESISQSVSALLIQQSSFHMVQSKKRPLNFARLMFMSSSFVKDLMQLKHDSGTLKTGASLQLITATTPPGVQNISLVVRLNIHLKSRSNI